MIDKLFLLGFFGTLVGLVALFWIVRRVFIVVEPERSVLILAFGKFKEELREAGLYFRPQLWIPGYRRIAVSRQLDYQLLSDLHVNDRDGATLRVDVLFEHRVVDAKRSEFTVESWPQALKNLVLHVIMEKMGHEPLDQILIHRDRSARQILEEVRAEARNWGIEVASLYIQDIRLLPEIAKQFFDRVGANLELKKARLEEVGRIAVHTLQAETEVRVAELQAQAKAMHPLAVGRAYAAMVKDGDSSVLDGFQELHQLSALQPGKVISFVGFREGEMSPIDVMMIPTEGGSSPSVTRSPRH